MKQNKRTNEIQRIRYKLYREAGYSVAEARKLRKQSLDVSVIKTKKVDGREVLVKNKDFYKTILPIKTAKRVSIKIEREKKREEKRIAKIEKRYNTWKRQVAKVSEDNNTVLSDWGYMTRAIIPRVETINVKFDEDYNRGMYYKEKTARLAKYIQKDMKLSNEDHAYYVLWYMRTYDISYAQAKEDFAIDPNFEMYSDRKRKSNQKEKRR
ncbi:MAG TPA: hypothetical protein PKN54_04420 [Candidatus Cloacimonas acidaminovorans]|nr:hypothetical protein [Candidatus Cloacimonas acidaminovorans]